MNRKIFALAGVLTLIVLIISGSKLYAADEAAKVGGSWQIAVETPRGTNNQSLTIQQDAGTIKGTIKGQRGEAPLEGSVDGNKINFTVKRETPNGTFTLEYKGTVEGDSMAGTVHSERFDGKWTAKRGEAPSEK